MYMTALIAIIAAYLIGSINFAVIFTKLFTKQDVRNLGSGNAGATNTLRVAGPVPGILTFIFDALKGFAGSSLGWYIFDFITESGFDWAAPIYGAYICGLACMLGHMYPIFFGFKGGKGVAISVGIYAVCSWPAIVIGLTAFALVLIISRTVSFSSLFATVTVVVLSMIFRDTSANMIPQFLLSIAMGAGVFIKHKENIKRLIAGTESRISIGGKHK